MTMKTGHFLKKRTIALIFCMAVLAAAAWKLIPAAQPAAAQTATQSASAFQTAVVRRGDISVQVSGTGTLVPARTLDLGFASAGKIARLSVQVGDPVKPGQVLAVLDNLVQLKAAVDTSQLAVKTAQQALDDLRAGAAVRLAQAEVDHAAAQKALAQAQANLHSAGDPTCSVNMTEDNYFKYLYAQEAVARWENYLADGNTGYSQLYIQQKLNGLRYTRDMALANWNFCQGYSADQAQVSQVTLHAAQATLQKANATLKTLSDNAGVDPAALVLDQAALKSAQMQLVLAQNNYKNATLTAPMAGIVTAVNGSVGQAAGAGAVIRLAALDRPQVQVNVDETDAANFGVGCPAAVTFSAMPDQVLAGTVVQVAPALVTVQNVAQVQGLIDLQPGTALGGAPLPAGLAASVSVTCQQAQNVLQVPVQALVEPAGQPAYVYILNASGQPEKRTVAVGARSSAFVEIRSGLKGGEQVITTPIQGQ
jgi:HlyD family secretion protein